MENWKAVMWDNRIYGKWKLNFHSEIETKVKEFYTKTKYTKKEKKKLKQNEKETETFLWCKGNTK